MLRGQKGITLVALVVTIVVLIILAAVSIGLVLDQDGIMGRAKNGSENYQLAANEESARLTNIESWIDTNIPQTEAE